METSFSSALFFSCYIVQTSTSCHQMLLRKKMCRKDCNSWQNIHRLCFAT